MRATAILFCVGGLSFLAGVAVIKSELNDNAKAVSVPTYHDWQRRDLTRFVRKLNYEARFCQKKPWACNR